MRRSSVSGILPNEGCARFGDLSARSWAHPGWLPSCRGNSVPEVIMFCARRALRTKPAPATTLRAEIRRPVSGNHLADLANDIVRRALAAGATDAECTISEGDEFSANVRMRELENLKEAGSRAAGLRILRGKHTGSSYTSDLSADGIGHLVRSAIELADITTEDPIAGLPEPDEFGSLDGDLQLYSADVESLETPLKIDTAKR